MVAHGDAREGKWRGNWRMEWVASTLTPPPNVVYPALLKLMGITGLPAVDWTDAPTDLNGLIRFGERRNLVSARVPSRSARAVLLSLWFSWIQFTGVQAKQREASNKTTTNTWIHKYTGRTVREQDETKPTITKSGKVKFQYRLNILPEILTDFNGSEIQK